MASSILLLAAAAVSVSAQSLGPTPEKHPPLLTQTCTVAGGCKTLQTSLVLDSLAHPFYQKALGPGGKNCGDWGQAADKTVCPDAATCQANCVIDGISDYSAYGVETKGDVLTLHMLRPDGRVVSPRVYLLNEKGDKYEMLKLTGGEFSFDVDVSALPCGMNGALYLSEMHEAGGKGVEQLNVGGAEYGTGYCDAQCYTTPFINGVPNLEGRGACCNEMDIWEANSRAQSIAPHTCNKTGPYLCKPDECAFEGVCDKWGCTYNTYNLGNPEYYGRGPQFAVDTTKPFTVVTQFPATADGKLAAVRRLYIQNGKVIGNAEVNRDIGLAAGVTKDQLDDEYCTKTSARRYLELGATAGMGDALSRGMVLIFSVWWDEGGGMDWLDGGNSGPCNKTEGFPSTIRQVEKFPKVTFSNVRWGEIGSTFKS